MDLLRHRRWNTVSVNHKDAEWMEGSGGIKDRKQDRGSSLSCEGLRVGCVLRERGGALSALADSAFMCRVQSPFHIKPTLMMVIRTKAAPQLSYITSFCTCVCVCVPACSTWGAGKVLEHLDRSVDDAVLAGWLCLRYYNLFNNRYSEQPLSDVLQEENWNLITALMQASLDMQQSFYRLTMTLKTSITQNTLLIKDFTQKQSLKCHCSICVCQCVFAELGRLSQFYLIWASHGWYSSDIPQQWLRFLIFHKGILGESHEEIPGSYF